MLHVEQTYNKLIQLTKSKKQKNNTKIQQKTPKQQLTQIKTNIILLHVEQNYIYL